MSGTFRMFFGWVHEIAGRFNDFMDARTALAEVETTGNKSGNEQELTVPADDTLAVYNWTTDGDFEAFSIVIDGEGYLTAEIVLDTPTSAGNQAASGSHQVTQREDIANHVPFLKGSDLAWSESLGANLKIYSITLRNKDEDADVTVVRGHVN